MVRSIPSMGHVIVLLSLLLYVYAVLGFHFFREADPAHWGSLGAALLTLFQMLTLEGWVEIQDAVLDAYPLAWIYFSSFVFVAVFVVVNLFIAVVINNLESVKHEQQDRCGSRERCTVASSRRSRRCDNGSRSWRNGSAPHRRARNR